MKASHAFLPALFAVALTAFSAEPAKEQLDFFENKIRPLLADKCYKCHSVESGKAKGELTLDTREGVMKGGEDGPAVVPGDLEKSLLIKAVNYADDDLQMPPKKDGGKLTDAQIADLTAWVKMGAPDPRSGAAPVAKKKEIDIEGGKKFRSFLPLQRVEPPEIKTANWARTPVDQFILAKLEAKNIAPNPPVEKRKLIRRVYFDLIGLPPKPEEIDAFVADNSPGAYEKLIDRLLASDHYGERWARHWLDLARFAESHGYEQDYDRPFAFHYRDFVIKALNDDLPYDKFVKWQIAGDELEPDNLLAWKATGFLAAGTHATQITANQAEKERYDELDDLVSTIGTSMLGITIGCARCHDHKYDPVGIRDYYAIAATFTKTVRSDYDLPLEPAKARREMETWNREHAPLVAAREKFEKESLPARLANWEKNGMHPEPPHWIEPKLPVAKKPLFDFDGSPGSVLVEIDKILNIPVEQRTDAQRKKLLDWYRPQDAEWQKLNAPVVAHLAKEPKPEKVKILVSSEGLPAVRLHTQGPDFYDKTFVVKRGDPNQKLDEAQPGFLRVLMRAPGQRWQCEPPKDSRTPLRRTALANWLTDVDKGAGTLLARVIVNRLWQHHFGRGIVATPSDFGAQGDPPTHPELLDFLASELVKNGWHLKPVHKLIMLSAAYMQGDETDAARTKADPDNLLWWHRSRQRLEAECIRDSILAVSGDLDGTMFGPGSLEDGMKRRSIYFTVKRSKLIPMMTQFDWPDSLQGLGRRVNTTVAPQALLLMNNPHVRDAAQSFAKKIMAEGSDANGMIGRAYLLALGRAPSQIEIADGTAFISSQAAAYGAEKKSDAQRLAVTDFCQAVFALNEFIYAE